jgi:response regulator RpfG family c-di-GMP phosphodiesterase
MRRCNILILDDANEGNQHLRDALDAEHTVVWVRKIDQDMKELAGPAPSFDLIICGVHLENESVFDLLKALRSTRQNKGIPFICFRCGNSDIAKASDSQIENTSQLLGATGYIAISGLSSDPVGLRSRIEAALPPVLAKHRGSHDVQN